MPCRDELTASLCRALCATCVECFWAAGDGARAVFKANFGDGRASAEAAATARRAGELAPNSFVAEPSTWPSSNETSVDSLRFSGWGFSWAV